MGETMEMDNQKVMGEEDMVEKTTIGRKVWNGVKIAVPVTCGGIASGTMTALLLPFVDAMAPNPWMKWFLRAGAACIAGLVGSKVVEDVSETIESTEYVVRYAKLRMQVKKAQKKLEAMEREEANAGRKSDILARKRKGYTEVGGE